MNLYALTLYGNQTLTKITKILHIFDSGDLVPTTIGELNHEDKIRKSTSENTSVA